MPLNKIIIVGRPDCPWCDRAVHLAKHLTEYLYEKIDLAPEGLDKLRNFIKALNLNTVPQVFIVRHGVVSYVGGFDKMNEWAKSQKGYQLEMFSEV